MTWVYERTEPGQWVVGHYDPSGKWHSDNDYDDPEDAAQRVHWLNGGEKVQYGQSTTNDYVLFLTRQEARSLLGGLEREENRRGYLSDSRIKIKQRLTDMLGGENWRALL